jgi:uncharacterized RDD family membrane protein YckC
MSVVDSPRSEQGHWLLRLGGDVHSLDSQRVVVGRSRSCDIRLRDDSVSRLHAAMVWREGSLILEDLGSSNGTWLNGERVLSPRGLRPGDHVRFGSLRGQIEQTGGSLQSIPAAPPPPSPGAFEVPVAILPGHPAGLGWRLLALLLDSVLFSVGSVLPFAPLGVLLAVEKWVLVPQAIPASLETKALVAGGCGALWVVYAWFYVLHGWARRAGSPGMRILGLRLLDWRQRSPIGYTRAWLRLAAAAVTALTLGLGFLVVAFRRDCKAVHDVLAGTLVTHKSPGH